MAECIGLSDLTAPLAKGNHQLKLVMNVLAQTWIRKLAVAGNDGGCRFHKKERWFAIRVVAHLTGVFCVIATNTENTSHREMLRATLYRKRYLFWNFDDIVHDLPLTLK